MAEIKEIFLDMDDVLCDTSVFVSMKLGKPVDEISPDEFWEVYKQPGVKSSLPMAPNLRALMNTVKGFNVPLNILSSIGERTEGSRYTREKSTWLELFLPDVTFQSTIFVRGASLKPAYARPGFLLIDDRKDTCEEWVRNGGLAILHVDILSTLTALKELLSR